jgi:hypothetical protein
LREKLIVFREDGVLFVEHRLHTDKALGGRYRLGFHAGERILKISGRQLLRGAPTLIDPARKFRGK